MYTSFSHMGNQTKQETKMDMEDFNKSDSPYLRADDIGDKIPTVTIKEVTTETMQDGEKKPCLWFENKSKGLVLNKTNSRNLTAAFATTKTDDWNGKEIELYVVETSMGPGLRVRAKDGHRAAEEQQKQDAAASEDEYFDDDIPF